MIDFEALINTSHGLWVLYVWLGHSNSSPQKSNHNEVKLHKISLWPLPDVCHLITSTFSLCNVKFGRNVYVCGKEWRKKERKKEKGKKLAQGKLPWAFSLSMCGTHTHTYMYTDTHPPRCRRLSWLGSIWSPWSSYSSRRLRLRSSSNCGDIGAKDHVPA